MKTRGQICVFAASSQRIDERYMTAARELGQLMAERGWVCVNGAGGFGLMKAVTDGVLDAGGHVTGVIPKFMVDNGWCYDRLPEVLITADMHERKQQMQERSDAIIALPGGCGTLEELLEVITWRQLGITTKPIILLNTLGFFDPLVTMLEQCVEQGFMKRTHSSLWTVAATPREALDAIESQLSQGLPQAESKY